MIQYNNQNNITEIHYNGQDIQYVYDFQGLVWEKYTPLERRYLTFIAEEPCSFSFITNGSPNTYQYSLDNGNTWVTLQSSASTPTIAANQKIKFKAAPNSVSQAHFTSTGRFVAEGNPMSMTLGDNFVGVTSIDVNHKLYGMFHNCTGLTSAENLALPATTLTVSAYESMFNGCTNLTTAPKVLPATTLVQDCYTEMFYGCSALTSAPSFTVNEMNNLDACLSMFNGCTSLESVDIHINGVGSGSCKNMFASCTSLTTVPSDMLQASTLKDNCYEGMFLGCSALTTAPELPALNLAENCYKEMFQGCTSLEKAPILSADTLVTQCYYGMFYDCTSLSAITCLATNISAYNCTLGWVKNVAPTGVFRKAEDMEDWLIDSENGIPQGWTLIDYNSYSSKYFTTRFITNSNTLSFMKGNNVDYSIKYSMDNGANWYDYTAQMYNIPSGTTIIWKGHINSVRSGFLGIGKFYTGSYENSIVVEGNIMSLVYEDDFEYKYSLPYNSVFAEMFYSDKFSNAKNLVLQATALTEACYYNMFNYCTKLTEAPKLPARTLATSCYQNMFYNCTSLTKMPKLPATTLAEGCYHQMFQGCTNLTMVEDLPATTLVNGCYVYMFYGCSGLTTAPVIYAENNLGSSMNYMFYSCTRLRNVECHLTGDVSGIHKPSGWLNGVASSGIFKTPSETVWESGANGIPTNWLRQDL